MKKPTPAQARTLKNLNGGNPKYYTLRIYDGKIRAVFKPYHDNGLKPSTQTMRILLSNGWIEKQTHKHYDDQYIISENGISILETLSEEDFISKKSTVKKAFCTTNDILIALYDELNRLNATKGMQGSPYRIGFEELGNGNSPSRRIDFWSMVCWPSEGYCKRAYEIKISRGDFLHEIKHPEKRKFAMKVSNHFYFVAPAGMIKKEEVPKECGLISFNHDGNLKVIKRAPYRECDFQPDWRFIAGIGRKIYKAIDAKDVINE